ncbi:MAG: hypothetical protein OHK0046_16300 [Anaerolineae bacterium]
MQQPPNPNRQIRLEIPKDLTALYSNAAIISQTHSEIIIDFTQIMPNDPRARVLSRVAMTPANAKSFLQALQKNLENFEARHGEIKLPPRPTSLADQLFSNLRPEDDDNNE